MELVCLCIHHAGVQAWLLVAIASPHDLHFSYWTKVEGTIEIRGMQSVNAERSLAHARWEAFWFLKIGDLEEVEPQQWLMSSRDGRSKFAKNEYPYQGRQRLINLSLIAKLTRFH